MTDQAVDDFLAHFGVKGMKWGIRKAPESGFSKVGETQVVKLKNGSTLSMQKEPISPIAKVVARLSPKAGERIANTANFIIRDAAGKRVGDATIFKDSPTTLNLVWLGIHKDQRGQGYATAAVKLAVNYAKREKLEALTLEVPGGSPDARHIYEKLGFRETGTLSDPDEDVWGGLTQMRLDVHKTGR